MDCYTKTEKALMLLAETFYEYAQKTSDGDNSQLDKEEMKLLLEKELVHFKGDATFEQFDHDKSGAVNFAEFMQEMARTGEKLQGNVRHALNQ
ncbi:unnamed protein product [Clavelina lepadiformis]|uniref:EF-hand domain-containing protein n=1 Tax=Clavelina lepadiformis TaxID=159417 RepID=A0ABP0EYY7_CLALP